MISRRFVFVAVFTMLVVQVQIVTAQGTCTPEEPAFLEDFEDDVVGSNPTSCWYTYSESGLEPGKEDLRVITPGEDDTAKAFLFEVGGFANGEEAHFTFTESLQPDTFAFYSDADLSGTYPTDAQMFLKCGGSTMINLNWQKSSSNARILELVGADNVLINEPRTAPDEFFIFLDFNLAANTFDASVRYNGGPWRNTTGNDMGSCDNVDEIFLWQSGLAAGDLIIDQLQFNGILPQSGPPEVETGGPTEFDQGLKEFASSAGFITADSQLFFSLILVGLATVATSGTAKWVAPGRFKNYLVLGVGALVAVFCVLLGFLDLWMFIVPFMLAVFAVRGGSEFRSTFFEIRDAIAERRTPEAAADAALGRFGSVMEVQVDESPERTETGLGATRTSESGGDHRQARVEPGNDGESSQEGDA